MATSGVITDRITAYSQLKLTAAGFRRGAGLNVGKLALVGNFGYYWGTTDQMNPESFTEIRTFELASDYAVASFQFKAVGVCVV